MKEIELTRGMVALVDDVDYEDVMSSGFRWMASTGDRRHFYAFGYRSGEFVLMHRLLTGAGPNQIVDHIDGNGLNNLRSNLRVAGYAENNMNRRVNKNSRTGLKGVRLQGNRYRAEIGKGGRRIHLGYFDNPVDAAKAYNCAAIELFGEFAKLNFV